jgi:two-component system, cell cycle response regulator
MTSPALGVLIVSGDAAIAGSLEYLLSPARGTRVQRAPTIESACATLSKQWIDAVLVDLAMIDGTELAELTRLGRAEPPTVLGLLRQDCALRTTEALQAGAQECLVFSDLTTDRLMRSLRQGIERQRVQQRLADLALRDELTGLYNRRGFFAIGEHLRRECLRNARNLAVVQVDVDGLKAINDSLGHAVGDQAIAATASMLRCTFRESDVVARLDGDEFVAIALDADRAAAARVLARLDEAVAEHNLCARTPYRLSFSAGASVLAPPDRPTLNALLANADHALYANRHGVRRPAWLSTQAPAADLGPTVAA